MAQASRVQRNNGRPFGRCGPFQKAQATSCANAPSCTSSCLRDLRPQADALVVVRGASRTSASTTSTATVVCTECTKENQANPCSPRKLLLRLQSSLGTEDCKACDIQSQLQLGRAEPSSTWTDCSSKSATWLYSTRLFSRRVRRTHSLARRQGKRALRSSYLPPSWVQANKQTIPLQPGQQQQLARRTQGQTPSSNALQQQTSKQQAEIRRDTEHKHEELGDDGARKAAFLCAQRKFLRAQVRFIVQPAVICPV